MKFLQLSRKIIASYLGTAAEKAALLDLLQAGAETEMLLGIPLPVTRTHFDRLMELVFSDK